MVPKDPFLEPIAFVKALAAFYHKTQSSSSHSHFLPPTSPTIPSSSNGSSNSGLPVPPTLGSSASPPNTVFLTQSLIESIESHYEKSRQSESYKVHRVLKNKLDDLATDLRTHVTESGGATNATTLSVTSDLAAIARCAVTSKDAPQSLRYFWTGRPGHAEKQRREQQRREGAKSTRGALEQVARTAEKDRLLSCVQGPLMSRDRGSLLKTRSSS